MAAPGPRTVYAADWYFIVYALCAALLNKQSRDDGIQFIRVRR